MLGSSCLHELNPCCLFICSHVFLVTEARNGCVVGLGVSMNAGGYFCSPQTPPELGRGQKKVYISVRMMR